MLDENVICRRIAGAGCSQALPNALERLRQSAIVFPSYTHTGVYGIQIDWVYEGILIDLSLTLSDWSEYILPYKNCVIELTDEEDAAIAAVYKHRHIGLVKTDDIEHYFKVTVPQRALLIPLPLELLVVIVGYLR